MSNAHVIFVLTSGKGRSKSSQGARRCELVDLLFQLFLKMCQNVTDAGKRSCKIIIIVIMSNTCDWVTTM